MHPIQPLSAEIPWNWANGRVDVVQIVKTISTVGAGPSHSRSEGALFGARAPRRFMAGQNKRCLISPSRAAIRPRSHPSSQDKSS